MKETLSTKQWTLVGAIGALGSLVMFVIMKPLIAAGVAPFNMPPSAAFLVKLGLPAKPLALLVHFGYGIVWSLILVGLFKSSVKLTHGLGLAGILWLVMMVVYSPIIGWGPFGLTAGSGLPEALQLGVPPKFIVATAVLHLIYGLILGGLNPLVVRGTQAKGINPTGREQPA